MCNLLVSEIGVDSFEIINIILKNSVTTLAWLIVLDNCMLLLTALFEVYKRNQVSK